MTTTATPAYGGQRTAEDPEAFLRRMFRHIVDEIEQYGEWAVRYLDPGPASVDSDGRRRYVENMSNKQLILAVTELNSGVRPDGGTGVLVGWAFDWLDTHRS